MFAPLLGERAGVRADVILACLGLWRHPTAGFHASPLTEDIEGPGNVTPDFWSHLSNNH